MRQAIVLTIISIARRLGLEVIAEGVETEAQRAKLAQLGCLHYPGYLFGRPLPATALLASLASPSVQPAASHALRVLQY